MLSFIVLSTAETSAAQHALTQSESNARLSLQKSLRLSELSMNAADGVPLHWLSAQIELSKLIDNVYGIGAGIMTLYDVINPNKMVDHEEVRSFFLVMEVYGLDTNMHQERESNRHSSYAEQKRQRNQAHDLITLRTRALEQLKNICTAIEKITTLFDSLFQAKVQETEQLKSVGMHL